MDSFRRMITLLSHLKWTHSIAFKRFLLSLMVVGFVDLLLVLFAVLKGAPTLGQLVGLNLALVLILALRFGLALCFKLRCPMCRQALGIDTGNEQGGFPVLKCPKCGSEWLV